MTGVHETAVVDQRAEIDSDVEIGPYSIVGGCVRIGKGCRIKSHVVVEGRTTLGEGNVIFQFATVGSVPQDLKYKDEPTRLRIGDHNVFREHVTANRANKLEEDTVIGSHNFLMANSHVGHNSVLGDYVILANGALLGGHVTVGDRAFISGNCCVHQFVRVGTLAIMQGGSAISKDLPPFCVARGDNGICGLNVVGLRRAGLTGEQRLELKRLYHLLFRSRLKLSDAVARARKEFTGEAAHLLFDFVASAKRGLCADTGTSTGEANEP